MDFESEDKHWMMNEFQIQVHIYRDQKKSFEKSSGNRSLEISDVKIQTQKNNLKSKREKRNESLEISKTKAEAMKRE